MREKLSNLFFNQSINRSASFILVGITSIALIIAALVAINSVSGVGVLTRNMSVKALEDQIESNLTQIAKNVAYSNDLVFEKISKDAGNAAALASNIFDNPSSFTRGVYWEFDESISKGTKGQYANGKNDVSSVFIPNYTPIDDTLKRDLELNAYLDFLFPKVLESNPNAVAIWTIGQRGEVRYFPNIELETILPPDFDSTKEVFYTPGLPKNNPEKKVKWSVVYDDPAGQGYMISAVAPIYTKQRGFIGVVGIDVTLNKIVSAIENNKLVSNAYTFLIDKNGYSLALPEHFHKEIFGKDKKENEGRVDLSNLKNEFGPVIDKMKSGKDGFKRVTIGGESHYVAYAHLLSTGFSLGVVAEEDEILSVASNLKKTQEKSVKKSIFFQIIPIGLLILLLSWLIGLFFIKQLTKPLSNLTITAQKISAGDLSLRYNVSYKNEIGKLATSFNNMVDKLKESYSGLENKVREKTAELAENVRELQESNDSLKNMDKAMINILEDAKELEDELKVEKAGVEKKVEERTADLAKAKDEVSRGWMQLQKEKARVVASITSLPLGFIMTDSQNNVVVSNPALEKIFTVNPGNWTIMDIAKQLGGSFDLVKNCQVCLIDKKQIDVKDISYGSKFLRIFIAPIISAENETIGEVILIEDITEAKVLERSRDEFFSIASHELRTPLTSIKGNTSLIQDYYADKINDKAFSEMISDIHDSSVRLIGIVNDFLDLSRLEQGRIEFKKEVFDIVPLIEKVVYDVAITAKEKKVTVKFDQPSGIHPNILADSARTKQIIYNLLGNAIKFTEKGSVTITIDAKDKLLNVRVIDTGKGVPLQSQSLLFRKFQQAENNILTRDNTQGTGLGLYISKLMAKGMGGDVTLEKSEENKGTTFLVSLPLATEKDIVAQKLVKKEETTSVSPEEKPEASTPPEAKPVSAEVKPASAAEIKSDNIVEEVKVKVEKTAVATPAPLEAKPEEKVEAKPEEKPKKIVEEKGAA